MDHTGLNKRTVRQIQGLLVFAAVLVLLICYREGLEGVGSLVFKILQPFLLGGAIAFVLNLPMKGVEERLFGKWKGSRLRALKRPLSILLSIVFFILLIVLIAVTVIPQLVKTIGTLGTQIPVAITQLIEYLFTLEQRYPQVDIPVEALEKLQLGWDSIMEKGIEFLKSGAVTKMLFSTFNVASGLVSGAVNAVIAFIFALYILGQKEELGNQGRRILKAYLPEEVCDRVLYVLSLLYRSFSSFITGQCIEAVILGSMFIVSMSLMRLPYAVMIGVLIAFTALIPIVGSFVGCAVGTLMILTVDPLKALIFLILFQVLQQIEGNLIYPRVVGNSVGLPGIWVLAAVTLGGSLFGVGGMLLFIPISAVLYTLLREDVNRRNEKKEKTINNTKKQEKNTCQEETRSATIKQGGNKRPEIKK